MPRAWIGPVAIGLAAVAKAFYSPAASAALPNVVGRADLPAANALGGSAWGTMLVVGASLGGILSTAVGPYVCFGITVFSLLISASLVWRIRRPSCSAGPGSATCSSSRTVAPRWG